MNTKEQGLAKSSLIIAGLIVVAVVILLLLPTPQSRTMKVAATANGVAAEPRCQKTPNDFSSPPVLARIAPAGLWKGWTYGPSIALRVKPASARVDQSFTIHVTGLEPGEPVTLLARMQDFRHLTWSAQATFIADNKGVVDTTREAPRYGSYSGVHPMGLVWSMLPQHVKDPQETPYWPSVQSASYPLKLAAMADHRVLAQVTLVRYLRAPGVVKTAVTSDGLAGELYTPSTPGPHPAIVVLGGSEGGWLASSPEAELLASHGYVALALAYFQGFQAFDPRLARLPKMLVDIPLEYFIKGADWLKQQPGVNPKQVAIIGGSKGAEAALITASEFPKEFQAVVAFMPSSVVWAGIRYEPGPISSSWTRNGKPLPWVNPVINPAMFSSGKPLAFLDAYRAGLKDATAVNQAAIPVERIKGPILLVSATHDQIWPSSLMSRQIMQRLAAHHHAYADEWLCYAGAGHGIQAPYRPTNASVASLPGNVAIALGGTPTAYAYADRDAWIKVLAFLHRALN